MGSDFSICIRNNYRVTVGQHQANTKARRLEMRVIPPGHNRPLDLSIYAIRTFCSLTPITLSDSSDTGNISESVQRNSCDQDNLRDVQLTSVASLWSRSWGRDG